MTLILASASPRRQELLKLFGVPFTVKVADIDETMDTSKAPFDEVARVSRLKAQAIARETGDVIIAADTIVVCEGRVLGKPHSEDEAFEMLRLLSGKCTYTETHNAFHDALDELTIMKLLSHRLSEYLPL